NPASDNSCAIAPDDVAVANSLPASNVSETTSPPAWYPPGQQQETLLPNIVHGSGSRDVDAQGFARQMCSEGAFPSRHPTAPLCWGSWSSCQMLVAAVSAVVTGAGHADGGRDRRSARIGVSSGRPGRP